MQAHDWLAFVSFLFLLIRLYVVSVFIRDSQRKCHIVYNECNSNANPNPLHYLVRMNDNWISIWIDLGFNLITTVRSAILFVSNCEWISITNLNFTAPWHWIFSLDYCEFKENTFLSLWKTEHKKKSPTNWSQVLSIYNQQTHN